MANFLTKLFSVGSTSLVGAIGEAIDKNTTTDEEAMELENEMAKASMMYALEEKKVFLADTASARDNQSRVQESEHASWLAKNVHSLMAVGIVGCTFAMYYWIMQEDWVKLTDSGMKDIVVYILGALTTISTQVAAYFFGSSQGSKDKQRALDSLVVTRVK